MKYSLIRMLLVLTLIFTWLGIRSAPVSAAGGCSGETCRGLDPGTMGCPAARAGNLKILPDGASTAETRVSGTADCNAKWARVYNLSGSYQWVAADLYCGTNYVNCQFRASPAKIASSGTVGIYTPMQPYSSTATKSCGVVRGDPGPITSVPLGTANCTTAN